MAKTFTFTKTVEFTVTDAEYWLVRSLYNATPEPKRVAAVKFIKDQYGLSLRDAKDLCDRIGIVYGGNYE